MPPAKNPADKSADEKTVVPETPSVVEQPKAPTEPSLDNQQDPKSELLSVQDVTHEVLGGRWGATAADAMNKLKDAGYDVDAVWAEHQRRKAGGAPSAF